MMKKRKSRIAAVLIGAMLWSFIPEFGALSSQAASNSDSYEQLAQLCAEDNYVDSIQFCLNDTEMQVNGETKPIDPEQGDGTLIEPLVVNERTLLPARALVEALNGEIEWDADHPDQVVIRTNDDTTVVLEKDNPTMLVDDTPVTMDVAPVFHSNRTFIPVRAVSEALVCDVGWNQAQQKVTITQPCQTCRLLVMTDGYLPDTSPSQTLDLGDDAKVLIYPTVEATDAALKKLEAAGVLVCPDAPMEAQVQGFSDSWEDLACGLSEFASGKGGDRDVVVAVIDSGIDASIPLLKDRVLNGLDIFSGRVGAVPKDENGHGTKVSSLIAAYTPENVKILPIKVFQSTGLTSIGRSQWVAALLFAKRQGAEIVNMSLSGLRDLELEKFLQQLIDGGVSLVCSAGNEGSSSEKEWQDTASHTPAGLDAAIVVAATDKNGRHTSFSNHGDSVDLAAPGENISTLKPGGRETRDSGTSFSAPLVCAAAATLLSAQSYTPAELEREIKGLTEPFPNGDRGYGVGILSLRKATDAPPPDEPPEPDESLPSDPPTDDPDPSEEPSPAPEVDPTPDADPEPSKEPEPAAYVTGYSFNFNQLSLEAGGSNSAKLVVTAQYSDGSTKDVTTSSGLYSTNSSVATVSNDGWITGGEPGKARIAMGATPNGVTVPPPVSVTVIEIEPDVEYRFDRSSYTAPYNDLQNPLVVHVMAYYSDGRVEDVTKSCRLSVEDDRIIRVADNGAVWTLRLGSTYVGAVTSDGYKVKEAKVTVEDFQEELDITVSPEVIKTGETAQITVTARYASGKRVDVSQEANFIFSGLGANFFDKSPRPTVTAVSPVGTVTVRASYGGMMARTTFQIKAASYWSEWSDWQDGPVTSTSTRQVETRTVTDVPGHTEYRYGVWRTDNDANWCPQYGGKFTPGSWWQDYTEWTTYQRPYTGVDKSCAQNQGHTHTHVAYSINGKDYWHVYSDDGKWYGFPHLYYFWEESRWVATTYKTQYRFRTLVNG